jgi:o-succinylbenzoate synthase
MGDKRMNTPLVELFRYELPLARPLRLKDKVLTKRAGLLLKFGYGDQESGYGDIAPLPGFSSETLEEAQDAVIRWSHMLGHLPKSEPEREEALAFLWKTPSVYFGIECATFHFRHVIGSPRAMGLFGKTRSKVSLNGLLSGTLEEVIDRARSLRGAGYRAAKLKVGRQSIEQDIEMVREVYRALNGLALRLDANRAWDFDAAVTFAKGIAACGIEYIEEPLNTPERLRELTQRTGLPIALDESITEFGLTRGALQSQQWAKAVVIKPTLLGSVSRCEQLAYEALEFGLKPVVSSSFESGVGIAALAHFAATVTVEDIPVGLDTYEWLALDVLRKRFSVRGGSLDIEEIEACVATLDTGTLERVYYD